MRHTRMYFQIRLKIVSMIKPIHFMNLLPPAWIGPSRIGCREPGDKQESPNVSTAPAHLKDKNTIIRYGVRTGICLLFSLVLAIKTFCQSNQPDHPAQKARFGIFTGFSISSAQASVDASVTYGPLETKSLIGTEFGVFLSMDASEHFRIQPSFAIIGKGVRNRFDPNDAYFTNRITYLELIANFLYTSHSHRGFLLGGGPALSYNVANNNIYSADLDFKKMDFGAHVVAGYEFPSGFCINLDYTHGLVNVAIPDGYFDFDNFKNRCASLTISYLF